MAIIKRTDAEYATLTSNFTRCYGLAMYNYVQAKKKGNPCECYFGEAQAMQSAIDAIASWQQTPSGSTTGYTNAITLEQLTAIINVANQLCY